MSDDQLYELARSRIDRRNRRWRLWAVDLFGLILSLALLIALSETAATLGAALFMAWAGVFTVHTILVIMANSHARDIENEVARLRQEIYAEKPKRLELSEDGELIDADDPAFLSADKREQDSV